MKTGWVIWILAMTFLIVASDKCGGGWHWQFDGKPHSLVLTKKP